MTRNSILTVTKVAKHFRKREQPVKGFTSLKRFKFMEQCDWQVGKR